MFKNVLRFVTTFGVLAAAYAAYTQAFALVAEQLRREQNVPTIHGAEIESKTKRQAVGLAVQGFGRGHWTSEPDLQIRYYNAERGFWMYAREYERLKDGKQLRFAPFALIWQSRDGSALKTVTSEAAVLDLDKPLGLVEKPGGASGPMRVVHARLEGEVRLRDDKGTPDPSDDLRIRPGPYIEYDEATLEITGDDNELVEIEDRDLRITGVGLLIKLRPKPPVARLGGAPESVSAGFDGAQTAVLRKNVDIRIGDVGPGGILPGKPRVAAAPGEKTPLHLRCDGLMQIDLPRTRIPARVGPPAPPGPTIAQFLRNVEVVRGKPGATADRLTCDGLHLTLLPADRPSATPARAEVVAAAAKPGTAKPRAKPSARAAEPTPAGGPLNELTLRRARATGHNVQISSADQGVKARCNELIHEKLMPAAPDETYFRGDATTKLVVEKVDVASSGPNQGKVTAFTTIRTIDATIFENGQGSDNATIVARGPGELESRPGLDRPVERRATWDDTLTLEPDPASAKALAGKANPGPVSRRITLTGRPAFSDVPTSSSLKAERTLVVWLKPKSTPTVIADGNSDAKASPAAAPSSSPSFEIEKLVALKNVLLTAPSKTLDARERLDAEFAALIDPAVTQAAAATKGKPAPAGATAATTPTAPASAPGAPNAPAAPTRPAEPEARASADVVWARVLIRPDAGQGPAGAAGPALLAGVGSGGQARAAVDKIYLRGGVSVHQDPAPGKTRGTDVQGEAVDLISVGKGLTRFIVFNRNPATKAKAKAAQPAGAKPATKAPDDAPAVIETEDMTIRGPVIGLDQATDEAWVDGKGSLTQMTTRGLLSDRSQPDPKAAQALAAARPAPPAKKVPLTIRWGREMKFKGQSTDLLGRPAARAEFYQDVRAEMEDSSLSCQDVMRTYLDRTVKLVKLERFAPAPADGEADAAREKASRPDIGIIELSKNAEVVNVKRDALTGKDVVEKQRILADYLVYDRSSGKFRVPGKGQVYLYQLEGQGGALVPKLGLNEDPAAASPRGDARVIRTSADQSAPAAAPAVGRVPSPLDRAAAQGRARAANANAKAKGKAAEKGRSNQAAEAEKPKPSLMLTQVKFTRDMLGRFGTGKETDKTGVRWADFFGDVEALHGRVPGPDAVLDADRLGRTDQFITSQILRIISEPVPGKAADAPPRYLLRAWENAYAVAGDRVIQADTLTYDSEKSLFYAYGEDGRDVLIAQQAQVGLAASTVQGRAAKYNIKTGESELMEPKQMALVDLRTGSRPRPVKPPETEIPVQGPKRVKLRNPSSNIERKAPNGR